ncbi:MAG: DUF1697 domain-containing protein [Woeseia sp.]
MAIWIAFFRGINVGGRHSLPMKELVSLFDAKGCTDVGTYIQSGNVVFKRRSVGGLADEIGAEILASRGFEPRILVLSTAELKNAIDRNPYPKATEDPKTLHLYFLASQPEQPDLESMTGIKTDIEQFSLDEKVLYLCVPDGIGRSKLADNVDKLLGVQATARNWRTVTRVYALACSQFQAVAKSAPYLRGES